MLVIIGVAASFFARNNNGASGLRLASDALFAVSMAFFCWGLICLVRNMGMFDSMVYGTKSLVRLLRNRWKPSQDQDGYLEYVRSRPRRAGVPVMMTLAAVFAALSVGISFMVK